MLELIIFFAIYASVSHLVDRLFKAKIQNAKSAEEAINIRKKAKKYRKIAGSLVFIIYITVGFIIHILTDTPIESYIKSLGYAIALIIIGNNIKVFNKEKIIGNISTLTKEEYLNLDLKYALFLRGFASDKYGLVEDLKNEKESGFSEYRFIEHLKQKIAACAVGMTKELDSPHGATRLYLEDETWKKDVKDLMYASQKVFILINDRESCIWEIEQMVVSLEKTYFLVDDLDKYNRAKNIIGDTLSLPNLYNRFKDYLYFIHYEGTNCIVKEFDNSNDSYDAIVSTCFQS